MNAALRQSFQDRHGAFSKIDKHEVRVASPVFQIEPVARGVEQLLRLGDLPQIILEVIAIIECDLDRSQGCQIETVHGNGLANWLERARITDEASDAKAGKTKRF